MTAPLFKVSDLKKSYGAIRAVGGVSFEVMPGEIFGVIGPNGSGKTTLFNSVLGQIRPDAGTIELNGHDITGLSPLQLNRRGVGRTCGQPIEQANCQTVQALALQPQPLFEDGVANRQAIKEYSTIEPRRRLQLLGRLTADAAFEFGHIGLDRFRGEPNCVSVNHQRWRVHAVKRPPELHELMAEAVVGVRLLASAPQQSAQLLPRLRPAP